MSSFVHYLITGTIEGNFPKHALNIYSRIHLEQM